MGLAAALPIVSKALRGPARYLIRLPLLHSAPRLRRRRRSSSHPVELALIVGLEIVQVGSQFQAFEVCRRSGSGHHPGGRRSPEDHRTVGRTAT